MSQTELFTDDTPMPWGKHMTQPMGEVPFDYLLKYYKKQWLAGPVLKYFEDRLRLIIETEQGISTITGKPCKLQIIEDYECLFPYARP